MKATMLSWNSDLYFASESRFNGSLITYIYCVRLLRTAKGYAYYYCKRKRRKASYSLSYGLDSVYIYHKDIEQTIRRTYESNTL